MTLGERLKNLRAEMKETLSEQSKSFSVSINTIYRWENDISVPRKSRLAELAAYYDRPLDWLLFGSAADKAAKTEATVEQQISEAVEKLSTGEKYRVLGYIERIGDEDDIVK